MRSMNDFPTAKNGNPMDYQQEVEAWRNQRLAKLLAEDGWATLVGLLWLQPGENSFGRAASNSISLECPALPPAVGVFRVQEAGVWFTAAAGTEVTHAGRRVTIIGPMASDTDGSPTVLRTGTLSFYLLERGGRLAIRVKDSAADARVRFQGLRYFPIDEQWRLPARFEPYVPVQTVSILNVLGMEEAVRSPGVLVFQVGGREHRLETVLESGMHDYFVMFTDLTNGKQTYAAGRCLYVSPPSAGTTVLDFNKAYNPPCCFTVFATCGLPQPQNRLPLAVTAGELKYRGSGH